VSVWALVPVKARAAGKQRLAAVLDEAGRARLVRAMLAHVLEVLRSCRAINGIAVLTPDPQALPAGVVWLADAAADMNGAVQAGLTALAARGARHAAVISADLPRLTVSEAEALLAAGLEHGVALASDRHGSGTNALALSLPARFRPQFGSGSLARHLAQARELSLTTTPLSLPGLAFDIDEPEDLELLQREDDAYAAFMPRR
jgi:2-phospho-L-lactate/phosphoenolpyruvate guanylyltransferase